MQIGVQTLMGSWAQECGKGFPFPPPENYAIIPRPQLFGTPDIRSTRQWRRENPEYLLSVTPDGALTVRTTGGRQTMLELARHLRLPKRTEPANELVLLNGDGFDDQRLSNLQAQLRNLVTVRFPQHYQRMIVPYAALQAASLDLSSLVPIHISRDRNVSRRVSVPKPPAHVLEKEVPTVSKEQTENQRYGMQQNEFQFGRTRYQVTVRHYLPKAYTIAVWHQADFSPAPRWHQVQDATLDEWEIVEQVHRLGEAVFRATGPDGTHRWISGFDQQENPAMYYLAQLPDAGGIRYITHAVRALAPPIVHRARRDGRRVFRQGDIFAVETDLTDDDMLNAEHKIADRDALFTNSGDVAPFTYTNRGYRLRKKLMIYGTGHTASRVCVTPRGTFIKGTMFHDPVLENLRANRQPEHQPVEIGDEVWFLAVRNTVPRQTSTDSS